MTKVKVITDTELAELKEECKGPHGVVTVRAKYLFSLFERLRLSEAVVMEVEEFKADDGDATANIWRGIDKALAARRKAIS